MKHTIEKIISGGQAGVDRAALDVALQLKIPHGGWCPRGRKAEDGIIPSIYHLNETESDRYEPRTELNVKDADGTLIITHGMPTTSTAFTRDLAEKHKKPHLVVNLETLNYYRAVELVQKWLDDNMYKIRVLNVAGPREKERSGVYKTARALLLDVFTKSSRRIPSI